MEGRVKKEGVKKNGKRKNLYKIQKHHFSSTSTQKENGFKLETGQLAFCSKKNMRGFCIINVLTLFLCMLHCDALESSTRWWLAGAVAPNSVISLFARAHLERPLNVSGLEQYHIDAVVNTESVHHLLCAWPARVEHPSEVPLSLSRDMNWHFRLWLFAPHHNASSALKSLSKPTEDTPVLIYDGSAISHSCIPRIVSAAAGPFYNMTPISLTLEQKEYGNTHGEPSGGWACSQFGTTSPISYIYLFISVTCALSRPITISYNNGTFRNQTTSLWIEWIPAYKNSLEYGENRKSPAIRTMGLNLNNTAVNIQVTINESGIVYTDRGSHSLFIRVTTGKTVWTESALSTSDIVTLAMCLVTVAFLGLVCIILSLHRTKMTKKRIQDAMNARKLVEYQEAPDVSDEEGIPEDNVEEIPYGDPKSQVRRRHTTQSNIYARAGITFTSTAGLTTDESDALPKISSHVIQEEDDEEESFEMPPRRRVVEDDSVLLDESVNSQQVATVSHGDTSIVNLAE